MKNLIAIYNSKTKHEGNNHVLTKKEISELYESLGLPKDKSINKADYLEFYMYYGNNLKFYQLFKDLKKQADVSWRDFRKIKVNDIDMKKRTIQFGHSINSITKETYTSR